MMSSPAVPVIVAVRPKHVSIACAAGAVATTEAITKMAKGIVLAVLQCPFMGPPYPEGRSTNLESRFDSGGEGFTGARGRSRRPRADICGELGR